METLLLTTKLFIPPARPGLVARPRLVERLRGALSCGLTLVSAQAGFGKTTLVSDWVRQNQKQCSAAWLSLDEGDNDPVRFWDYFIAALRTLKPAAGEQALSLLHSPQPYPTEAVLTALINDLSDTLDDFAVVLDDYHLMKAEAIQLGITFLLDHLPPKMHLVIATRTDPPLPLAHFRGRGTMLEIGADDLRFTFEEAAALLKEMLNVELAAEDVSALNDHTEGWAVGLKMAALSMSREKNVPRFISTFTGSQRYVMDYLIEEVLKQQSEEVKDFLLKTSVLERLTASLCDSLTGHGGSQEMLVKLEQANLFLIPLDESRQWYRYHHLFAELLRHQLEVKSGLEEVAALRQRASQWYEDNGFSDDAIHHALLARDWKRAMRLIYAQSGARIKLGEWNTLFVWLQIIPDEVLRTQARLYSQYANVLLTLGRREAAEAALGYLERTAQDDIGLQGEVALYQTILARWRGDKPRQMELAKKALYLLTPDKLAYRARASYLLGVARIGRFHLEEALSLMTDAYEMGRQAGDYFIGAGGATQSGKILWLRGRLRQALRMSQRGVDLAAQSPAAAGSLFFLAEVLYELNDLEEAALNFRSAVKFSELGGFAEVRIYAHCYLARIHLARGDSVGALAAMEKADQTALKTAIPPDARAHHAARHVMLAIHQDDLVSAITWGKRLSEYENSLDIWWQYVPAQLLIATGEKPAARERLRSLYETAAQADAQCLIIRICVYQALAAETQAEALAFLTEALTLGQPEGFIRTFVDEGKLLALLLRIALARGVTPEYTAKLLNIIEAEERQRQSRSEATPSHPPTGILSERELEILRLLATGLSNRQIAERLIISLSTAKTHVHNIFEKLNARTRTQAAALAKELKLI